MEKSIFEQICGTYCRQGDYLLPDLAVPEGFPAGVWGQRHLRYIREYRRARYTGLRLSGEADSYLVDIGQQAQDMFSQLIKQTVRWQCAVISAWHQM